MRAGHVIVWIVVGLSAGVLSHPQCLDFRPPFEARNLEFCHEYAEFGCCTAEDDLAIEKEYHRIITDIETKNGNMDCREKLRAVMCLKCHPYAAHVYDAEQTQIQKPFPGLCQPFCEDFYDTCRETVPLLTEDEGTQMSAETKSLFCEHNASPDPDYCYPDLDSNDQLLYNINREGVTSAECICLEEFASGLRNPLVFEVPPDETRRIFIAEQKGLVYIYYPNKTRISEPFMDLSSMVHLSGWPGDEKGFLGLAFHPNYAMNRRLFVYYSIRLDGSHKTRLSEYRSDVNDTNKVDENSERVILDIPQPYDNHNGGALFFGVDGYLYLSLGDGGAGGDPQGFAQNLASLLGKVIRLDVDAPLSDNAQYVVPLDNPFINDTGVRPEIFAYGLRNMWRCDVDEGDENGVGRGRIICGDVGQGAFEEIDIIKPGKNYGWNTREGYQCYGGSSQCGNVIKEELPIHAYPHSDGKSVTGGHVYRGCLNPNFYGKYIYGDYVKGALWALEERPDSSWKNTEMKTCGPDVCFNGLTGRFERNILSFGKDYDGEMYMLTTSYPSSTADAGFVYKFVDPWRRGDPTNCRSYKANHPPQPDTTTESVDETTEVTKPIDQTTQDPEEDTDDARVTPSTNKASRLFMDTCIILSILKCFHFIY